VKRDRSEVSEAATTPGSKINLCETFSPRLRC
jgi:hypothetical protein